jgi:hypothetical protein
MQLMNTINTHLSIIYATNIYTNKVVIKLFLMILAYILHFYISINKFIYFSNYNLFILIYYLNIT